MPFLRFILRFFEKEVELARTGITIQLLVPPLLFSFANPTCDATEFFGFQAFNCVFDLLHPAHI